MKATNFQKMYPVSRLAFPLTKFNNKSIELREGRKRRSKDNISKSMYAVEMKRFFQTKEFPERTWLYVEIVYDGKRIKKGVECFQNMNEYAYVMFSHSFFGKGRVSLSIFVTDLDGKLIAVYNIADAMLVKCYVTARGQPEPEGDKCYIIAVTFNNDENGNPDLFISCFNR